MADDVQAIAARLAEPFDAAEVKFKPQAVSGNRALAIPFVDARVVMDRLDEVLGVMGWQDSYTVLPDGAVVCRLSVKIGGEWITKEDVGGQSEQPDEGDRRKSAFSDALKRVAVKFAVGRYLYRCKPQWADYDPAKRQFTKLPTLSGAAAAPPAQPAKAPPAQAARVSEAAVAAGIPDPREAERRVYAFEGKMAGDGLCKAGEVVSKLTRVHGELWRQTPLDDVAATCKAFRKEREASRAKAAAAR